MAGHSKWKNIQHRKGAQDAKRGKIFTKIAVEITVAVRVSGSDPEDNPRLRAALAKAKAANMPKENCQRAIKKGSGEKNDSHFSEKTYEGYGPAGIAVIVECLTDNANRTVSEVRHAFSRSGGNLGTDGSVSWQFHRKGLLVYKREKIINFDDFFESALEHGAEDVTEIDDFGYQVTTPPEDLLTIKSALDPFSDDPDVCETNMIPENVVVIDEEQEISLEKLINALEDKDDVQNVYHNAEV